MREASTRQLDRPVFALAFRLVAAALSFGFGIAAARLLGMERFGIASVLLGIVNVGVVFALLGHETLATRQVATLDASSVQRYRRSAARHTWLAGGVILFLLLLVIAFLPLGTEAGTAFLALLVLVPLIARTRLSQGLLRGAHRASLSLVPDGIARPGLAILFLLSLGFAGYTGSTAFALAMLLSAVLALAFALLLERRTLSGIGQASSAPAAARRFSAAIFISSILAVLVSQLALIATGILASAADAGLYAAAERFSLAAGLVGQAVYLAVASRLAAHHARGETAQLRALVRKATRGVTLATLLLCGGIVLAARPLLDIYGTGFAAAEPVLLILLAGVFFNAFAGPTGQLLLMTRNEQDHMRIMFVSLVSQAVLIAFLVPMLGYLGAAWAVLLSTVIWNGLMMYFIKKRLALNPLLAWA